MGSSGPCLSSLSFGQMPMSCWLPLIPVIPIIAGRNIAGEGSIRATGRAWGRAALRRTALFAALTKPAGGLRPCRVTILPRQRSTTNGGARDRHQAGWSPDADTALLAPWVCITMTAHSTGRGPRLKVERSPQFSASPRGAITKSVPLPAASGGRSAILDPMPDWPGQRSPSLQ